MAEQIRLAPPRRVTVVESIIEQIVGLIQSGALKPGDKLPSERELIKMLGVSRSSVREAMQGLAAMDLVEGRAGEGTYIKPFKPSLNLGMNLSVLSDTLQKEVRLHVNEARFLIEQEIAELAARKINDENREMILAALEHYEQLALMMGEKLGWRAHDRIHLTIAEATGNPVLLRILQSLLDLVPRSLRDKGLMIGSPEEIARRMEEEKTIHQQLCHAIVRGDAAVAESWIVRHAQLEDEMIQIAYGE